MTNITATEARSDFYDLIKKTIKGHAPIRIQHKSGDVVLISEGDYEALLETLEILSAPNARKKIKKAKAEIKKGHTIAFEELIGK
ncbi:MAG: hypothetical protein A3G32_01720 [Deltaproteobacteria bacterium RIFCSPLOWO2_12_FULL_40_28]|nr:MAG: hypothetical protein A3C45_06465 [Deltaproteobacteria bacterium RIFCSPHIGHO2_02_FULL_40_28]OGQ18850.1 MAG: hypothetical protein A3E27_09100 [Deltaproteobacteria bacterium RIFCSPHIGHO2_12_FULL_40_32]OGQ40095.1 MAG: hypothetical protein A3I69_01630 [Deltaproteobacteria bacterium RIFCSPLOWO2_02_FULL_40_36]OGQ53278.1 MAG: hypothetical protein A3G32_01720 [Deltaproteobacteria bacterium RIFCSPLOWO2_12_FULL_40_28]